MALPLGKHTVLFYSVSLSLTGVRFYLCALSAYCTMTRDDMLIVASQGLAGLTKFYSPTR